MQVFAYKMCNFLKKVFQCPPFRAIFLFLLVYVIFLLYLCSGFQSIERREDGLYLSDPVLQLWLNKY